MSRSPTYVRALLAVLRRTAAQHNLFAQAAAAQLGIGSTDLDCLLLLLDFGPASAGQLADVLGLTTGAVTGVVDRLVGAGFAVRENDPSDRRRVIVQAVADQAGRVDDVFEPVLAGLGRTLEPLAEPDLARLFDFEHRASAAFEQATARLRADQASSGSVGAFSSPLLGLESASLEFVLGASNLRLSAGDEAGDELYRATFEGLQPSVRVQGGSVVVRYKRIGPFEWRAVRHAASMLLSPRVGWSIALRGGAAGVELDLRGLDLRGLSIQGGASKVDVLLPLPRGTVSVCVEGGANRVQVQHPEGAPVQLQVHGGANRLEFDAQRFGAVGGDVRLATPGWELAADRYVVEVGGGASRLTVQELQEIRVRAEYHE
jgi:DNA-binding MarR family transcriptional regulator